MKILVQICLSALLLLIGVVMISAVKNKKSADSKEIIVSINEMADSKSLITEDEVLDVLKHHFGRSTEGMQLGTIELDTLEAVLENEPFVTEAEVFLDARGSVNIHVEQRRPIARFLKSNGKSFYLDEDGYIMPISRHLTVRVPIITGAIPELSNGSIEHVQNCLPALWNLAKEINADQFLSALIEQIHISAGCNVDLSPKVGSQTIHFGKLENVEDKLKRLASYYETAVPLEGWRRHSSIDLAFDGQIVCKKK